MRNRRLYLIIVAVAVLLSGCIKSEIVSNKISFAPVASKATRAIITGTTYPQGESFVVSAFHTGNAPYFESLTASYSSTLDLWATREDQYWPLSGSLTFKAYSPSSLAGVTINSSTGAITATDYTIDTPTKLTTDFCYGTYTVDDCSNHPSSVPLQFSHALAQVVFRVTAGGYYNDESRTVAISMTSLSLDDVYSVGDFSDGTWSNPDTEHDYTLSSTTTALTYTGTVPDTTLICSYLLVPQTLSNNAALTVGYTIAQTVNSTTFTFANDPVTIPLRGTITQWEPGRKYIYTISIGLNDNITFTATADDWTSVPGGGVVVE